MDLIRKRGGVKKSMILWVINQSAPKEQRRRRAENPSSKT